MRKTGTESAAYFGLGGEKDGFKKRKAMDLTALTIRDL